MRETILGEAVFSVLFLKGRVEVGGLVTPGKAGILKKFQAQGPHV